MDISDLIRTSAQKLDFKRKIKNFKPNVIENISLQGKETFVSKNSKKLTSWLFISFIFIILIFIFRLTILQILNYEKFQNMSEKNYIRSEIIYPNRGLIYDRNGIILVKNIPKYILNQNINKCLIVKNRDFSNCKNQLDLLHKIIEFKIDDIMAKYDKSELIAIKRDITKDEAIAVGSLKNIDSIEVSILPQRDYAYPNSMSHLLGYVGPSETKFGEYEGKLGVEKYYQSFLAGISGSNLYKSDSYNSKLDSYQQISPVAGKDIELTIDSNLQNYAYELLKDKVNSMSGAIGGVVVAQDPRNGDVLALVNYPTFDLNKMTKGMSETEYQSLLENNSYPFLNRAISGVYPPGSVFKIVTASGILQEEVAKPTDTIFDEGFIKIGESVYANWKHSGHGVVDMTRSLQVSNDTYYYIYSGGYKVPKGLGISGIYKWGKNYKIGETLGIDLNGESSGFLPDGKYKTWYLGDTFITAIGQGDVLATPIQMTALMSYFANNQKAFTPRVVLEADNLVRKEKILYENLLKPENYEVIKNSLKEVNLFGGTAYPFFDFNIRHGFYSAGKTGTSEYFDSRYQKILTHAWYSGFAPYDQGEIVVTVFIESGGGGSDDAAPIARKVMDFYFDNKK